MINGFVLNGVPFDGALEIGTASGALVSVEQHVYLRNTASGAIVSIEQNCKTLVSAGAIISIAQIVRAP